jgi:SAM-dependent methyltransferase
MATVSEHYENLLAEHYTWMSGDFAARVEANRQFFSSNGIKPGKAGTAVDLGAGPGFQSIALALLGFKVTAIDLSAKLLDELKQRSARHPVTIIRDDLLNFRRYCPVPVEQIVCMGDTLPHLDSLDEISVLFKQVHGSLVLGGKFVMTFRDLTRELKGLDRFIPVKSDANTVFTCFLEYAQDYVQVHDLVYTKKHEAWEMHKSSYRKLRIPVEWTIERLKETGFTLKSCNNDKGMVTMIAEKKEP